MPESYNVSIGKDSLTLEDQGTLEDGVECSIDFVDITTVVVDIHLPKLFNYLTDLHQFQDPTETKAKEG